MRRRAFITRFELPFGGNSQACCRAVAILALISGPAWIKWRRL